MASFPKIHVVSCPRLGELGGRVMHGPEFNSLCLAIWLDTVLRESLFNALSARRVK